jgi:hypothetical protein
VVCVGVGGGVRGAGGTGFGQRVPRPLSPVPSLELRLQPAR